MREQDEKRIDYMVESVIAQVAPDGPITSFLKDSPGDAKALLPLVHAMGHAISELWTQIGVLDARLHAFDGED